MPRKTLILCLILSIPHVSHSQEYSYIDYTVKDGLAGSKVYSMVRDKDGFLWFGTETGLSRFDGTHFKNFYTADGLPDNEILKLFVDSRNRVWIVPFKNALCYYARGRIHNAENDSLLRKLRIESEVVAVVEDSAGNILIAQDRSLYVIDPKGNITEIRDLDNKPIQIVQAGLHNPRVFRLFLTFAHSSALADVRGNRLVLVKDMGFTLPNNFGSTYLSPQMEALQDKDTLHFFNKSAGSHFQLPMPKGFINISGLGDSTFLINTNRGAYLLGHGMIVDSFLIGQEVNGALEDPEGGLWFSTLGAGVFRLGSREVLLYKTAFPVCCLKKIDTTLYAGTDHYLLWAFGPGRNFKRVLQIDNRMTKGSITALASVNQRGVIIGTDAGTFLWPGPNKKASLLWQRGAVKALAPVDDTTVLECSYGNARLMSLNRNRALDTLWKQRTTCGCLLPGAYYIGTLEGLFAIRRHQASIFLGDRYPALKNRINALQSTPDGAIWVATGGGGVIGFKGDTLLGHFTSQTGLNSDICRAIFISGSDIWVGTDKGLDHISRSKIVPFTTSDGLSSDIINTIYVEGNDVFTGTSEGINRFDGRRISQRSICNLRITGIAVSGQEWPLDTTDFKIPHKDNDIQFDFVAISYKSGGDIRYRYKLGGLDDDWKTTTETSLHYHSLPSGNYELQLYAINKLGLQSTVEKIPFTIDKRLWERVWFQIASVLVLGGCLWLLFQYRLRAVQKKTAIAGKIAELEQMALIARMNPHFIFNCLNSIQNHLMDKDIRAVNGFITNFSRLIRLTLEMSFHPRISLQTEIDYISTYLELERRRFENKFEYGMLTDPGLDTQQWYIPPLILQPYIENAILHGIAGRKDDRGRIEVRMSAISDRLVCVVEDNGVGRKQAAQNKAAGGNRFQSLGMALTAKRIHTLNVSVTIEDLEDGEGNVSGTRITVNFPILDL